jgi:hypothetical protein
MIPEFVGHHSMLFLPHKLQRRERKRFQATRHRRNNPSTRRIESGVDVILMKYRSAQLSEVPMRRGLSRFLKMTFRFAV